MSLTEPLFKCPLCASTNVLIKEVNDCVTTYPNLMREGMMICNEDGHFWDPKASRG